MKKILSIVLVGLSVTACCQNVSAEEAKNTKFVMTLSEVANLACDVGEAYYQKGKDEVLEKTQESVGEWAKSVNLKFEQNWHGLIESVKAAGYEKKFNDFECSVLMNAVFSKMVEIETK